MVVSDYKDKGFIEGYAAACDAMIEEFTGYGMSCKSYDPLTVNLDSQVMSSYAFDMKDGTRGHPLCDYEDIEEVCSCLLKEASEVILNEMKY